MTFGVGKTRGTGCRTIQMHHPFPWGVATSRAWVKEKESCEHKEGRGGTIYQTDLSSSVSLSPSLSYSPTLSLRRSIRRRLHDALRLARLARSRRSVRSCQYGRTCLCGLRPQDRLRQRGRPRVSRLAPSPRSNDLCGEYSSPGREQDTISWTFLILGFARPSV